MSTALTAAEALRRARAPQRAADARPAGDVGIGGLRLRGPRATASIQGALTSASLERTIEGASVLSLSVEDPERALYGLYDRAVDVNLDGLWFRLVGVAKHGDGFELTFEDREIAILRSKTGPRKANRAKVTRAQFVRQLVREVAEVEIGFRAPELTVRQPVDRADGNTSQEQVSRALPYEFSRGQPGEREDSWTAIRRLADEVQWRAFVVAGVLWFARDATLLAQVPAARVSEATPGVDWIDWDIDSGRRAAEATVTAQAGRWAAPPGSCVALERSGPANGRWLVQGIRRGSLFSPETEITLTRARPALPEPAPETETAAEPAAGGEIVPGAVTADGIPQAIAAAYAKGEEIHQRRQLYQWGGGHNASFSGPYDCSGGASAVLRAGGLVSSPMTTTGFAVWGQSGPGRWLTVWVREISGAPARSHMFLEFRIPGRNRWWEAGGTRGAPTGWRSDKSTAGFSPRHAPGT